MNHQDTVIDIDTMLNNAEPRLTADCCIYKVPCVIRRLNEDAYTPKVLSIGPFHHHHHHQPRLQNMERQKLIYFKAFLQRHEATTQPLIHYVESIIPEFRRCYSETLDFTDQELVKLILIGSGFIIELFRRYFYDVDRSQYDAFLLTPRLDYYLRLDLLLLENQLPFFLLEMIFNISFRANLNFPSFLELTFEYFLSYNKSNLVYHNDDISIKHFTDLIRIFHLQHPWERRPNRIHKPMKHLHSVTELLEAGVRFKVDTKSECLLDLRFSGGVLEIPQLRVDDSTEILFRNMLALEQCHYPETSYITDYVVVLDFLINTGRDVDILVQKGILVNWLGDGDSVANLFNSLWKNIIHVGFGSHYYVLCEDLNRFYSDPWHQWEAILRRWKTAASAAGIFLLILTLLQTACSVWQVIPQKNADSP